MRMTSVQTTFEEARKVFDDDKKTSTLI